MPDRRARGRRGSPPPPPAPPSPAERLTLPLARSGLPGAATVARAGKRMGIGTVRDLLFHLPRRYEDLRELRTIHEMRFVEPGQVVSARVRVVDVRVEPTFRRRVQRTVARLEDDTGSLDATWFGRRFIERRLRVDDTIVVSGKVRDFRGRLTLDNPEFQRDDGGALLHAGRIVPIYRLTAGLTAATLRRAVRGALDSAGDAYPEYLDPALRSVPVGRGSDRSEGNEGTYGEDQEVARAPEAPTAAPGARASLLGIGEALEEAHYPTSFERRDAAIGRLAYDELLALQIGMVGRRRARTHERGDAVEVPDAFDLAARSAIRDAIRRRVGRPVDLTPDQDAAIAAIRHDLAAGTPMLRLLQGDVGSGKTAVAAWALAAIASTGRQGALLAPTDLLARQHQRTLIDLLEPLGIPVELLSGSLKSSEADRVRDLLASGLARVVVGTHALISESVAFADLGLVVIDEQHRFGVEQRGALEAKAGGRVPHVLLMTATPIPRTLGQVLYADLDVTDLRTPPEGRVPIRTAIRRPDELDRVWSFVREEAASGRRTFVVVPLITQSSTDAEGGEMDDLDDETTVETAAVAAESEAVRLREALAPLRVGLVHGRMRPSDRDAEMGRFRDGSLDVLVGTTVVEVGVDVPEASMMVIEGADRFGLAQLHQLRGRVGRGTAESYCVLVSDTEDDTAKARLAAVRDLRDGFDLAEKDWELRREGDVLGLAQSGLPRLRVASLQRASDRPLVAAARAVAERLLDADGSLAPGHDALAAELASGWLARVAAGDAATPA